MKRTKQENRVRRHWRVRSRVKGDSARPRLAVYRSNKYILAQVIDDVTGKTLAAASSQQKALREQLEGKTGGIAAASLVGKIVAERAKECGVGTVCFDRGGYRFHGRVKALARPRSLRSDVMAG